MSLDLGKGLAHCGNRTYKLKTFSSKVPCNQPNHSASDPLKFGINIYESPRLEVNLNSDEISLQPNVDSDDDTIHSASTSHVNGITYTDSNLNTGPKQILFEMHQRPTKITTQNLFNNKKQRLHVKLSSKNLKREIKKVIQAHVTPNSNFYCLFRTDLLEKQINQVLNQNFHDKTIRLIKCKQLVKDVESETDQIEIIRSYHLGETNHRGIRETYDKLKTRYYWPNLLVSIQKFINNCNTCQRVKHERNPYKTQRSRTKIKPPKDPTNSERTTNLGIPVLHPRSILPNHFPLFQPDNPNRRNRDKPHVLRPNQVTQ